MPAPTITSVEQTGPNTLTIRGANFTPGPCQLKICKANDPNSVLFEGNVNPTSGALLSVTLNANLPAGTLIDIDLSNSSGACSLAVTPTQPVPSA